MPLVHLVLPRYCVVCGSRLQEEENVMCHDCLQHLPRTGYHLVKDNASGDETLGVCRHGYADTVVVRVDHVVAQLRQLVQSLYVRQTVSEVDAGRNLVTDICQ